MDPNLKQRIIDEAYVLFLTKGMKQTSFCDVAAKERSCTIFHPNGI